jgi:hypothetical protein
MPNRTHVFIAGMLLALLGAAPPESKSGRRPHLELRAGERYVRIHFTHSPPTEKAGEIDAGVLKSWDAVLDAAEKPGPSRSSMLAVSGGGAVVTQGRSLAGAVRTRQKEPA